jgi:hypothetical protein
LVGLTLFSSSLPSSLALLLLPCLIIHHISYTSTRPAGVYSIHRVLRTLCLLPVCLDLFFQRLCNL